MRLARKTELGVVIVALGVFFMPFDALPMLPGMYRPLSVFITLVAFLYVLYHFAIRHLLGGDRASVWLLAFYLCAAPLSLVGGLIAGDFAGAIDFLITFSLGFVFYLSCLYGFRRMAVRWQDDFPLAVARLLLPLYCVGIAWGALEALSMFVSPLQKIVYPLTARVAEIPQFGVQWFSREPSWGAINILGFLPFLRYYVRKTGKLRILVPVVYVEILLSLSLSGIVTMLLIELVMWLLGTRNPLKRLLLLVGMSAAVYLSLLLLLSSISGLRLVDRFRSFVETGNIVDFLRYSSSETVRIGFPIAGVMEIAQNPVTGVGGGNSRYYLAPYVYALMPWASSMHEVSGYLNTHSSFATPRNLFARIIGEQGILGAILFGAFVTGIWRLRRNLCREDARVFTRIFVTALLINLQFDSWALAPMWLSFAFLVAWGSLSRRDCLALAQNAPV